jgi:hypothetical protein
LHHELLNQTKLPREDIWYPRNDTLGVFFYPPQAALVYAPLALLPLADAQVVQAVVNVLLILVCGALLSRYLIPSSWATLSLLMAPPVFVSFVLGQNGIFSLAVVLGALALQSHQRNAYAGLVLSLLVYKPTWLLSAFCLIVGPGIVPAALGLLGGALALTGLTSSYTGWSVFSTYAELSSQIARIHQLPHYSHNTQSSTAGLWRSLVGDTDLAFGIFLLTSLLACLSVIRMNFIRHKDGPLNALGPLREAVALSAAAAINPHVHHYDTCVLWTAIVVATSLKVSSPLLRTAHVAVLLSCVCAFFIPLRTLEPAVAPALAALLLCGWLLFLSTCCISARPREGIE